MPDLKKRQRKAFYISFLLLAVFRFSYMGFRYIPYLDDYIQYIYYPSFNDHWNKILTGGAGILFTRPLAGLADFYIWSFFHHNLGIAVIIISLLYGVSGILFCKAFHSVKIHLGYIFLTFFVLYPLNSEGTYWLSASSRIVVSLFFISISLYLAVTEHMWLFSLFNLISLWFYEQTAVLSFALGIIFCTLLHKPRWIVTVIANFIFLAVFYIFFGKNGDNAHRMSAISIKELLPNITKTLSDTVFLFCPFSLKLITNGFIRGSIRIFKDYSYLWFTVSGILAVLFSGLAEHTSRIISKRKVFVGLFTAIVPLLPFFLIKNSSINLRNIVPCLLGVAIIMDTILPALFKSATPIIITVALIVFSLASATEVYDYNKTAQQDLALAKEISQNISETSPNITVKIKSPVYPPQNAPYRDHIKSVIGSDWGITGIVRTVSGIKNAEVTIIRE